MLDGSDSSSFVDAFLMEGSRLFDGGWPSHV